MPVCYSSHQAHELTKKKPLTLTCEPFQGLLLVSAHLDARMGSAWDLTFPLPGRTLRDIYGPLFSASMFPSPHHKLYPYLKVS